MRNIFALLWMVATLVWGAGCAEIGACPQGWRLIDGACAPPADPCPEKVTRAIQLGCVLDPPALAELSGEPVGFLTWELTVEQAGLIESGKAFSVDLRGKARFGTDLLNLGLIILPEPFYRVPLTNLEARVQVRRGAIGEDVVLGRVASYSCTYDDNGLKDPESRGPFPPCSPESNLEDGLSNEDCRGLGGGPSPVNRCLDYYEITTSDDCEVGGVCDRLGQVGEGTACANARFCVTDEIEILLEGLEPPPYFFTADTSGSVLFGWAERGVEVFQSGPERGVFNLEQIRRPYNDPISYSGVDVLLGLQVAFECIPGKHSRRSNLATTEIGLGRSPDSAFISCPIQAPQSD